MRHRRLPGATAAIAALVVALATGAADAPPDIVPALRAMQDELRRSLEGLAAGDDPAPYFLSYHLTDLRVARLSASSGAVRDRETRADRLADVEIRVGDRTLDNFHRVRGERAGGGFRRPVRLPLDDDPVAIRAALWLETDRQYREAIQDLSRIRTRKEVNVREEDESDDFSTEEPSRSLGPAAKLRFDAARWEPKLRAWSALLEASPLVYRATIDLTAEARTRMLVTSEGTLVQEGTTRYRLTLYAATRADDGMDLYRHEAFDAREPEGLPDDRTVRRTIERMVREVLALREAPIVEPYTGPAILEGRAAGVFFHEIFGHRIEGHRQKDEDEGQTFTRKIGQPVLPEFLTIHDDPTVERIGEVELSGSYRHDDEGVPARRVTVVDRGVLRSFLLSRSPVAGFDRSNGHGRKGPGFRPVGRQANLIVETAAPVTDKKMREMLIEECRRQGKPFGLVFRDISGGFTVTGRDAPQAFQVTPILVYRVFADGRPDELVRGVDLIGTPLASFGKILAAGDRPEAFNGSCGAESGWVPVSAVSPAILTAEIEIQKKPKSAERPPLLPPPRSAPRAPGDPLLEAMRAEVSRAVGGLTIGALERPYFIEYAVADLDLLDVGASLGALVTTQRERIRPLRVDVRVGGYELDNSEFLGRQSFFPWASTFLATDDDVTALRRDLWYATDLSYKRALEQIALKRAVLRNRVSAETLPDFSKQEPVRFVGPLPPAAPAAAEVEALARRVSAVFREFPEVQDSDVVVRVLRGSRYVVNSEGTEIRQPWSLVSLVATATTQAADGMRLWHAAPFFARDLASLPSVESIEGELRRVARELAALAQAPVLDRYVGPVLVTAPAAAETLAILLAPELSGQRPPVVEDERASLRFPSMRLAERLGRRVLPTFLDVADDPTLASFDGKPLLGGYAFDEQGVPARPVSLVEKGMLRSLLLSRRPRKEIAASNGHARGTAYAPPGASISNLVVRSSQGKSLDDLKGDLIALCREQGMEYGLRLERLDQPLLSGRDDSGLRRGTPETIPPPVLAYKVHVADGREELVRGLVVTEMSVRTLREIVAAGGPPAIWTRPYVPRSFWFASPGALGTESLPVTIVTPSLLFEDLELKRAEGPVEKPARLPSPLSGR